MKKFLMMALVAILLLSTAALAEPVDYHINVCKPNETWVGITSANAADVLGDGTVSYDAATNTLTLNNANLLYISGHSNAAPKERIQLIGSNTVTIPDDEQMFSVSYFSDLEIFGSGSLTVSNSFVDMDGVGYPCIQTEGDLTISGAKIVATSKDYTNPIYCIGDMKIENGANVTSNAGNYPGLWSMGNMTIDSSTVNVTGTENALWANGEMTISGNSKVKVTTTDAGTGIGSTGDLLISDNAQVDISGGWALYSVNGGIEVSGGVVQAFGSNYAIVNKPDLSNYANVAIYAGENASSAVRVSEDTLGYYQEKYVKICSASAIPATGDGFNMLLWCGMLILSAGMMALVLKKRYN